MFALSWNCFEGENPRRKSVKKCEKVCEKSVKKSVKKCEKVWNDFALQLLPFSFLWKRKGSKIWNWRGTPTILGVNLGPATLEKQRPNKLLKKSPSKFDEKFAGKFFSKTRQTKKNIHPTSALQSLGINGFSPITKKIALVTKKLISRHFRVSNGGRLIISKWFMSIKRRLPQISEWNFSE